MSMRKQLVNSIKSHANGEIHRHLANVEVYLTNPVGIGEHANIPDAISSELDKIALYHDQLEVLKNYVPL